MSFNQLNSLLRDFMPIFLIFELSKINYPRTLLQSLEITAEIECLNQPDKKLILERIPPDETITHYFISSPDAGGSLRFGG